MQLTVRSIATSPADPERDDLAYVCIRGDDGYVLSLSRALGSALVEVMVKDQLNAMCNQVKVKLTKSELAVEIPDSIAAQLDGHTNYLVNIDADAECLSDLYLALSAVFAGIAGYEHAL